MEEMKRNRLKQRVKINNDETFQELNPGGVKKEDSSTEVDRVMSFLWWWI